MSGRSREALEQWIGSLPIWLHAEHGFWSRPPGQAEWTPAADIHGSWREPVLGDPARHHRAHARARSSR